MRRFITAGIASMPILAFAGGPSSAPPLSDDALNFILDVEYWGTIESRIPGGDHAPIHAVARVDGRVAPPEFGSEPGVGVYEYNEEGYPPRVPAPSNFVTSNLQTLAGPSESEDRVSMVTDANHHAFAIENREFVPHPGRPEDYSLFGLEIDTPEKFLDGVGLIQEFDVRPAAAGGRSLGWFDQLIDGVGTSFRFVIDRIRVTPKVCRP
jgi:hypothetical protein